ncbi:MAG TPA: hypothetical protein PKM71_07685 [Candidatus Cloacimonas sp.]|nr:hypothetical protein [Candidatus Cloacimonas sp.]
MTDLELQLISTDKLAEELATRFDCLIIHGIQKDPKNNNKSLYFDHWKGDHATILGLCDLLRDKAFQDYDKGDE